MRITRSRAALVLPSNLIKKGRAVPAPGLLICTGTPPWFIRLKVIDPFPSVLLAENRARFLQAFIKWAGAKRPTPFVLIMGILEVIIISIDLPAMLHQVVTVRTVGPEPLYVHLVGVNRRLPFKDPLGYELAHTACPGDTID